MNQKIDKTQIKHAIIAINRHKIANNGEISNEYNGYISSFGAAVIQSGVLPALAFFESDGNSQKERKLVITAIKTILKLENIKSLHNQLMGLDEKNRKEKESELEEVKSLYDTLTESGDNELDESKREIIKKELIDAKPLFDQMMELNENQLEEKEKDVLEAGVALKLAIRTFKLKK